MTPNTITFDAIPQAIYDLTQKVDHLMRLLENGSKAEEPDSINTMMTVEELSRYLPGKPAISSLYGMVQRRELPYGRAGKRLFFVKSEIDAWLTSKKGKTRDELAELAKTHHPHKKARKA